MGLIVGGFAALIVGAWWLRGGWVLPVLLTVGYCGIGGLLALDDGHTKSFLAVVTVIWLPFAVWRLVGRTPRPIVGPGRVMVGVERR